MKSDSPSNLHLRKLTLAVVWRIDEEKGSKLGENEEAFLPQVVKEEEGGIKQAIGNGTKGKDPRVSRSGRSWSC